MNGRTIKFRAWDTEAKEMLHWHDDQEAILQAIPLDAGDEWTDRCIVEQFCCAVDNQGRDIYEGDIISFSTHGHPHGPESDDVMGGVVWWDIEEAAFAFGRWTHPHCDEPFDFGYAPCQIRWSTVRVVGNIHEHSHLITP